MQLKNPPFLVSWIKPNGSFHITVPMTIIKIAFHQCPISRTCFKYRIRNQASACSPIISSINFFVRFSFRLDNWVAIFRVRVAHITKINQEFCGSSSNMFEGQSYIFPMRHASPVCFKPIACILLFLLTQILSLESCVFSIVVNSPPVFWILNVVWRVICGNGLPPSNPSVVYHYFIEPKLNSGEICVL